MSADPMILKILAGMQAGVEVALADGIYLLGSGPDDDIQLVDVSLLPGYARLRIAAGKAEIAAQAGTVLTGAGEPLAADGGWRALEPLEAVMAGTTRFALGPRSANWASVGEDARRGSAPAAIEAGPSLPAPPAGRARMLALPVLALIVVALFGGWYAFTGGRLPSSLADHADDLRDVRAALDVFPFGVPVETRQEVDGAIYVTGYVETPVQRRALAGALDRTGVSLHLRLFVLEDVRREIAALIAAEKAAVTFSLSEKGEVALEGLILRPVRERKLAAEIGDTVLGVSSVVSHVRTADTLLDAVRQLVAASQLKPWLVLRLDDDVIEVSGALPSDKVDAWVGFLQTYATRFAGEIPLRSFVQLQTPNGRSLPAPGAAGALALGAPTAGSGDTVVDVERLRRGDFALGDVFVGARGPAARRDRVQGGPGGSAQAGADAAGRVGPGARGAPEAASAAAPGSPSLQEGAATGASSGGAPSDARPDAAGRGAPGSAAGTPPRGGMILSAAPSTPVAPPIAPRADAGNRAAWAPGVAEADRDATSGGPVGPTAPAVGSRERPAVSVGSGGASSPRAAVQDRVANAPSEAQNRGSSPRQFTPGVSALNTPAADVPAADVSAADIPAAGASAPATQGRSVGDVGTAGAPPAASPRPARGAAPADGRASADAADDGAERASTTAAMVRGAADPGARPAGEPGARAGAFDATDPALVTARAEFPTVPDQLTADASSGEPRAVGDLVDRAARALKRFRDGESGDGDAEQAIDRALALLESRQNGAMPPAAGGAPVAGWYLPLFVDPHAPRLGATPCWDGTALTADDVLPVLFWLDILSASRLVTLTAFDQTQQSLLIEAALDPKEIRACSRRTPEAASAADHSLYLREMSRNPGFVSFVLRDLPVTDLDVAGASLGRRRFVITRSGTRMAEGAAPDRASRIAVVGELGIAVQHQEGLSVLVFGPDIAWVVAN